VAIRNGNSDANGISVALFIYEFITRRQEFGFIRNQQLSASTSRLLMQVVLV